MAGDSKSTEKTLANNDAEKLAQDEKANLDDYNRNNNVNDNVDAMTSAKEVGEVVSMTDNIPGVTL